MGMIESAFLQAVGRSFLAHLVGISFGKWCLGKNIPVRWWILVCIVGEKTNPGS